MDLPAKLQIHLKQSQLISKADSIFVACSGGPDSTALFYLLQNLPSSWKLKLGLVHFNHGLRGRASDADELFVRKLAKKFKVPFYSQKGNIKKKAAAEKFSEEEAARSARYGFFEILAKQKGCLKFVTAHNLEDQAETVLMRFLQGTGLRGLCGIREKRQQGNVLFVRPLLPFSKKEILTFLKSEKITYRKDASNDSDRYLRNRIRRKLIPFLEKQFNPRVVQALARVPASLTEEAEVLTDLEENAWKRVFLRQKKEEILLRRNHFLKLPPPLQFRLLERSLRSIDPKAGLGFDAWQRLKPGLRGPRLRHSLPKDIDLELTPSKFRIYKKARKAHP